jgi:enamine deaminase RidA (YjgF/YER057c/UK114 family)
MTAGPYERLADLGLSLPTVVPPVAAYVPAVRSGQHVYVSGQLPMADGALLAVGKVGAEVTADEAKSLAQRCALNALAAIDQAVGLDAVTRIVKVTGSDQRRLRALRGGVRRGRPARPQRGRGE